MHIVSGGSLLSAEDAVPLPYLWLWKYAPITRLAAVPTRAVLPAMLCLVVIAATGLMVVLHAVRARWRPLVIGLASIAVLFEFLPAPYPLRDLRVPQFYRHLAASSGTFAVAEVPLFGDYMVYMYYQTAHHKPLLAGHVSRLSPHALDFVRGNALLRDLQPNRDARPGEPVLFLTAKAPPGADVGQLRAEYGPPLKEAVRNDVAVIVIHRSMLTSADVAAADRVLSGALGLTRMQEPDGIIAYYLEPPVR